MPNYNGVWSLTRQFQYNTDWQADNVSPARVLSAGVVLFGGDNNTSAIDKISLINTAAATDFLI